MKRRSFFAALALAAAAVAFGLPLPAAANAPNDESATYRLVTPVANLGEAPNGDHARVLVTQPFFFGVHPKSVSGGGTFTHVFTGGSFSTTWTATELLDFQPYGCGRAPTGATLPANF